MTSEMDLLGQSRLISDQWIAGCTVSGCEQLANAGGDERLKALRHVKETGHTVRLWRSYCEELTPRPPRPTESAAAERRRLRKQNGGQRRG